MLHNQLDRKYRPVSVAECLKKIRDKSSLLIDLTYYSLLYTDRDFVSIIFEIGNEISQYWEQLIIHTMLATGSLMTDLKLVASFMNVAHYMKRVVDSILDFTKLLTLGYRPHPVLLRAIEESEESVAIIEVHQDKTIDEIFDDVGSSMDVIAVKCDNRWILDPEKTFRLKAGSLLIVRTTRDVIEGRISTVPYLKVRKPMVESVAVPDEKKLVRDLVYMKSLSEVVLDMAYFAILTLDKSIIEEVEEIEHLFDLKHLEFERKVLTLEGDPIELLTLIRYSLCLEEIVDTAYALTKIVESCPESVEILQKAIRESDEVLLKIPVTVGGRKLSDLKLDDLGLTVLAIKRAGDLIVLPDDSTTLQEGDVLLVKCYRESLEEVKQRLKQLKVTEL